LLRRKPTSRLQVRARGLDTLVAKSAFVSERLAHSRTSFAMSLFEQRGDRRLRFAGDRFGLLAAVGLHEAEQSLHSMFDRHAARLSRLDVDRASVAHDSTIGDALLRAVTCVTRPTPAASATVRRYPAAVSRPAGPA
jgi:hypothetical protein